MLINFPVEEYEAYAKYYISYYEEGKKAYKESILKNAKEFKYKAGPWYRRVTKSLSEEELNIIENAAKDTYKGYSRTHPIYDFLNNIHNMENFYEILLKDYVKRMNICGLLKKSGESIILLNEDEYLEVTKWKQTHKNL